MAARFLIGFSLIMMLSLAFLMSCVQPAVPSPTPAPAPPLPAQTASAVSWSADGVIQPGEYAGMQSYTDCELSWLSDGQYIYIGMKAKTTGWVAMAIQPGSRMKNADIVLGFVKDGKATVYDQFSDVDFGPHPQDTELGGTNDILEFAGKEEGGYTTIEFKRKLDTGDKYDNPLAKGKNQILWSYGPDDTATSKHVNRGYGEITL
jgi:hypothetical protein